MEEYIRFTGDTTLSAEYFDVLDRLIKTFHNKMQAEGIIENFYGPSPEGKHNYWNFYEWSHTMSGNFGEMSRRLECPINCFYSLAMQALARICDALGKDDYAADLRARVVKLNAAIAKMFYNPEARLFETFEKDFRGTYTVLTQSLALLCGAADGVDSSRMLEAMATNGKTSDGAELIPNSLSMNAFRFDALLARDKAAYAPIILDELDRDYLYMLRKGATAFWETIEGADAFGFAGSLCHGWSALPVYYYEILCN
jgi:glycogen debranching enzyme